MVKGFSDGMESLCENPLELKLKPLFSFGSAAARHNSGMFSGSAHPLVRTLWRGARRACAGGLLCAVALGLSAPVLAGEKADHDRARQAVQSGQVLPLRTVLERLEREAPGQVLEVELEHEHGQWVYEIKVLQADGRVVKLLLDARDARVLHRRQR